MWFLIGCQPDVDPPETDPPEPSVLTLESASPLGGVADLVCDAEPAAPLRLMRQGAVVAEGPSPLVLPAHLVVAGAWVCEAADGGGARAELDLEAPGGNLLVMLIDDMGIDNFAAYGVAPDPPPMPNLDALAATGVRFEVAWAMPMCSPTRAALLTGRYPRRTGVGGLVDRDTDWALPLDEVTVPEVIARGGYTSALTGKWHLAPARPEFLTHPGDQGFAWHGGSLDNLQVQMVGSGSDGNRGYYYWQKDTNGVDSWAETYATTDTVDDAIAQAATLPEPWFLYVAFNAPHIPYDAPPDDLLSEPLRPDATDPERYDALVEALDAEIGRLLASIDPDVLARTTIVTLGDNGSPDQAITPPFDPAREKGSMLEGGMRVPLVVNGPLVAEPGSVSRAFVDVTDLLPTAAALAGVPLDDGVERDGFSWLPWIVDPDRQGARQVLYAEKFEPNGLGPYTVDSRVVKDATHRLVRRIDGEEWLFRTPPEALDEGPDLLLEPELAPEDAQALERLRAELDRLEAALAP